MRVTVKWNVETTRNKYCCGYVSAPKRSDIIAFFLNRRPSLRWTIFPESMLDACRMYEPSSGLAHHRVLCYSEVEHQSADDRS